MTLRITPALRRLRQEDLSEFKDSLVYKVNARTAKTVAQRNCISKNLKKKKRIMPKHPTKAIKAWQNHHPSIIRLPLLPPSLRNANLLVLRKFTVLCWALSQAGCVVGCHMLVFPLPLPVL